MDLRPCQPSDHSACLAVFDSNTPDYFAPSDRAEFDKFLHESTKPYFVMEHDGALLGCGGYYLSKGVARLSWGMVDRAWHRRGLGRLLLLYRLREVSKSGAAPMVQLSTSQLTAPFFERQGFKRIETIKDGYAAGIDRVEMAMKLTVCP